MENKLTPEEEQDRAELIAKLRFIKNFSLSIVKNDTLGEKQKEGLILALANESIKTVYKHFNKER